MKEPEAITLSEEEINDLRQSLLVNIGLSSRHRDLLIGLLDNHIWLQFELKEAKMSIDRLRKIFGVKSEKRNSSAKNDNNNNPDSSTANTDDNDLSRGDDQSTNNTNNQEKKRTLTAKAVVVEASMNIPVPRLFTLIMSI